MTGSERWADEPVFTYDVSPDETLSDGVLDAVASVIGVDPTGPSSSASGGSPDPLYTVVDLEALDSLFRMHEGTDSDGVGALTFTYHGHRFRVHSDGRIVVDRPDRVTGGMAD